MNIKRFALAAADEIDEASCFDEIVPSETIERHMQAAIDEATAPLRARIEKLEGLGPLIHQYGEAKWSQGYEIPTEEHGSSNEWVKTTLAEITAILKGDAP